MHQPSVNLQQDVNDIYLGNTATVDSDMVLPSQGRRGSAFRWSTDDNLFLNAEGKVNRPSHGVGSRTVVLHLIASYGDMTLERDYAVTILEQPMTLSIVAVRDAALRLPIGSVPKLPSVVTVELEDGSLSVAPVVWDTGAQFDIYSLRPQQWRGTVPQAQRPVLCRLAFYCPAVTGDAATLRQAFHQFTTPAVALTPGSDYYRLQENMHRFLLAQKPENILYNFRRQAGIRVQPEDAMTGWDAADSLLRGHTTGHYLSALAACYSVIGDPAIKQRVTVLAVGLAECQDRLQTAAGARPGFLSAYPETQFDELEALTPYPQIWAPYYTLDKILAGLLDCHQFVDCEVALRVAVRLGDWVTARLAPLDRERLAQMWSMYIAGEFGAMMSTLLRLYAITGHERYRVTARLFTNDKLFAPMQANEDTLNNLHANQHIPQAIGAFDRFISGDDLDYYHIARHFWHQVVEHHSYCIGGTGETEMFRPRGGVAKYLSDKTAETCASYNMLKLSARLFRADRDGGYMNYYAHTLDNHILAAAAKDGSGGTSYFMPLAPGGRKKYDTVENTCCHGTGMEIPFLFQQHIFALCGEDCFVNLFIPSTLVCREKGVARPALGEITLTLSGEPWFRLLIREPEWAAGVTLALNGAPCDFSRTAKGYLQLAGGWRDGDRLAVAFHCHYRFLPAPDDASICALAYGPLVLAACHEQSEWLCVDDNASLSALALACGNGELVFRLGPYRWLPLNQVDGETYHVYFRRQS